MMRFIGVTLVFLLMAGCSETSPPAGPALIVYASEDDPANLLPMFTQFTAATGIPIDAQWGDSGSNANAVIAKQGASADVLISSAIADIVRAADKGALRPISSESLAGVRRELKDPDSLWVSLSLRSTVIAFSPDSDELISDDYEELGLASNLGRLCLSSIKNSVNQSLIAWLIDEHGLKPAERVVRGWVRNLALPPFATEKELLAALLSGACQKGILSAPANSVGLRVSASAPEYFEVTAMGVGRHAHNPDRAQRLIDWLIVNKALEEFAGPSGKNVDIAGRRNEEALLLAERVRFN
jgi:iron(III) transport system substrate-binding protein